MVVGGGSLLCILLALSVTGVPVSHGLECTLLTKGVVGFSLSTPPLPLPSLRVFKNFFPF